MSLVVTDLELDAPLPVLKLPSTATGVFALVRRCGRPVGLARLDATSVVTAKQLQTAITTQVQEPSQSSEKIIGERQPISIIVCTHERVDDMRRCLDALVPLAEDGHEVIIVDNAPTSRQTAELAARYPFRYLCEPKIGLDNARNHGLRAASHAIVAYTDDDAVPDRQWAAAITQPFADPCVGCVTGLVLPLELETTAQVVFEQYCVSRRTFERVQLAAPQTLPAEAGIAGMGANMAFRRQLVQQLGGFDPRLDAGTSTCSGGDTDMFAAVLASGSQIVYAPGALVWHRHRREISALRRCIFGYGVGLSAFLCKRMIEDKDLYAVVIAARWMVGPFVKAARRWWKGQPFVPLSLLLLEAAGMLVGPFRLLRESRSAAVGRTKKSVWWKESKGDRL